MKSGLLIVFLFLLPVMGNSQEIDHNTLNFGLKLEYIPSYGLLPMAELNIPISKNYFGRIGYGYTINNYYKIRQLEVSAGRVFKISNKFDISAALSFQNFKIKTNDKTNLYPKSENTIENLNFPIEFNYHLNKKFVINAGIAVVPVFQKYENKPQWLEWISFGVKYKFN